MWMYFLLWILIEYWGFVISNININKYQKYLHRRRINNKYLIEKNYNNILEIIDNLSPQELHYMIKLLFGYNLSDYLKTKSMYNLSDYLKTLSVYNLSDYLKTLSVYNLSDYLKTLSVYTEQHLPFYPSNKSLNQFVNYLLFLNLKDPCNKDYNDYKNKIIINIEKKLKMYFLTLDKDLPHRVNFSYTFKPYYIYTSLTYHVLKCFLHYFYVMIIKYYGFTVIKNKYGKIGYIFHKNNNSTPIILFPGIISNYNAILNSLSFYKDHNLIIFIPPTFNNHFSLFPKFVSMDEYCEYLHEFLRLMKIKKIKVVTNSFGSSVYSRFIKHPHEDLIIEKQLFIEPMGYSLSHAYNSNLIKKSIYNTYHELILQLPEYYSIYKFLKLNMQLPILKNIFKSYFFILVLHNVTACHSYYFTELNTMWIDKNIWDNDKTTILLSKNDFVNNLELPFYNTFSKSKIIQQSGLHGTWSIQRMPIENLM
jgi:hypothetical protein